MKRDPNLRASARLAGDLLREERRAADLSLTEEFAASERDFEALINSAAEPELFERMLSWLRQSAMRSGWRRTFARDSRSPPG